VNVDWYTDMVLDGSMLYIVGYENYNTGADGHWVVDARYTGTLESYRRTVTDPSGVGVGQDLAKGVAVGPDAVYIVGSSNGHGRIEARSKTTAQNTGLELLWEKDTSAVTYNSVKYINGRLIVGGMGDQDGDRLSLVEIWDASDGSLITSITSNVAIGGAEYFNAVDYATNSSGGYSVFAGGVNFVSAYRWHIEEYAVTEDRTKDGLIIIGNTGTTINVQPGSSKSDGGGSGVGDDVRSRFAQGDVDIVQVAIVTDGTFQVLADDVGTSYDRLGIEGLAFYNTGEMKRNLLWEDAALNPAVELHHDPRFLYLFRDMLGRRLYSEFECGIVSNPDICEGW
jgi:hypothetical protein